MVKEILLGAMIHFFRDAGSEGRLLFAPFAKDNTALAIAVKAGVRTPKERDNFYRIARKHISAERGWQRFVGYGQVHGAGIAGQEDIALVDKGGQLTQRHAGFTWDEIDAAREARRERVPQPGRSLCVCIAGHYPNSQARIGLTCASQALRQ